MTIRPRRSALYLPADKPRALAKARTLPADVVILDLEDAVAPDAKPAARAAAVAAVAEGGWGKRELLVRANGLDTVWGPDDLAALAGAAPDGVVLPKVSSPETLHAARARLPAAIPLWAMVETCAGVLGLEGIARDGRALGLAGLIVGPNDLAKELRCRPDPARTALLPLLSFTIAAARAHGLAVLDGVFNDFADSDGLSAECAQGALLGFDGKTLIHPAQIDSANRAFAPTDEEVAWSRAVVAAFADPANAGRGVITVAGRMAELLHLDEARRVLALAEA